MGNQTQELNDKLTEQHEKMAKLIEEKGTLELSNGKLQAEIEQVK